MKSTNQKEKLMYEGIYIWDAKYGVPKNHDEDSIDTFLEELSANEDEINDNLYNFTQFFGKFLQEANEIFADDRAISENKDLINWFEQDEPIDVILYLDELPRESIEHYSSMLNHATNLYNLTYYDPISDMFILPTDPSSTETNIEKWQTFLTEQKKEPVVNEEALPTTKAKVEKLIATILKERVVELNIPNCKIKANGDLSLRFKDISIDFLHTVTSLHKLF